MITNIGLKQLGFSENDYVLQDDGDGTYIAEWNLKERSQPTEAEIEVAHAEWQAEQDATQYQRDRQGEYPSIDEPVVALWEGVVEERMASVTALEAGRQAVKTKYPKP